ncbi:MAG TPA: AraC family transcriptional regulator [Pyrinomonadaceae bacterium]|nr:AraC family transcriptional regulator [Pyrinomonadaceae bacterium]
MTPEWKLKFWQIPHLDLELLHAAHVTHDYPAHIHEDYSIAIVLAGTEITTCNGVAHPAAPGQLLLVNPRQVHSNRSIDSEYRALKLKPRSFDNLLRDLRPVESDWVFPRVVVTDSTLFSRLLQFHLSLEQDTGTLAQQTEFISVMSFLLKRLKTNYRAAPQPVSAKESEKVRLVRDYLQTHFAENISLTQLTSLTNLSPYYLLRVFHNHTGLPPHEYQTQLRIAQARKLIRKGMPLSHTALETGFCDQSHFSRNFKRIVGVTPRQYFSAPRI